MESCVCGKDVRPFFNFCPYCGKQLKEEVKILSPEEIKAILHPAQT